MSKNANLFILPKPKKATISGGRLKLPENIVVRASDCALDLDALIAETLPAADIRRDLSSRPHLQLFIGSSRRRIPATRSLSPKRFGDEGYRLTVGSTSVFIEARSESGLLYGLMSLRLLLRNHDRAPQCVIEDWPDLAVRGIHMDLKGCTPTVDYMKRLIPQLAEYKVNTLLMEYENAIQLDSTPGVAKPSAWSKDEVAALADLARRYRITLMPLLQSLGHVEYILEHERYAHLSEDREDVSQYCPSNNNAFEFFKAQADEIIELFPESKYFHVGADETHLLGHCRRCRGRVKKGEDALDIYLEHMNKVWSYTMDRGYTPIFWDDIVARDFSPDRIRRIPKGVAVMYWLYNITDMDRAIVRVKGGYLGRRESIRHEQLRSAAEKVRKCGRWLDEMDPEMWRHYRKYIDDDANFPNFDSTPFIEMFADYGIEVLGASGAKCGSEARGMPHLARRLDNIRAWARQIARAKQTGVVSTAWSRGASLRNPYLTFDSMWYTMAASAEFYWSSESDVDEFQASFTRDFFGLDDDGWLARVLEASATGMYPVASRDLAAASVERNANVLEAYQIANAIEVGFTGLFALMERHARGHYLDGRPHVTNRNIHGRWLKRDIQRYLGLEKRAAIYYHSVMPTEEADELLASQFDFFKSAGLGLA